MSLVRPSVRLLLGSVVALLISLSGLALAAPASAVLEGRNGRIAFTSGREGANDNLAQIYLRTVTSDTGAGSVSAPVGLPGVQNRHASFSPDRTKIVFAAGTPGPPTTEEYDLYIRDLVANTVTPLDASEIGDGLSSDHPAWSPDGSRVAYEHQTIDNSTQRDIMVKTVGSGVAPLSLTVGGPIEFKPAWSPDSSEIYYAKQSAVPPASNLDIVKRPATGGAETGVAAASGVDEYQPSISPDGSKICFTLQTTPGSPASAEIYTASLPSLTGLTNISDDNTKGDINCTWSPDGTLIAYVNGVFSQGRLVMKRSDDSSLAPVDLEDDNGSNNFDGNPDWAPDGSPECPDGEATTRPDTPLTIELECVDSGPAYEQTDPNGFVTNEGGPEHGTLSDFAPLDNPSTVVYTPDPGFSGKDRIIFGAFDDFGFGDDTGTVSIAVGLPCAGQTATISGTDGNDDLKGTPQEDIIAAAAGNDKVRSLGGGDIVCAGSGKDEVKGGGGKDTLKGGSGDDRLRGGGGNDRLKGGPGKDELNGGAGKDTCSGGHKPRDCEA
jgi:Tol biopolymer transport system component